MQGYAGTRKRLRRHFMRLQACKELLLGLPDGDTVGVWAGVLPVQQTGGGSGALHEYSKSEESRAMRSRGRETQSKQPTKRTDVIRRQQG